MQTIVKGYCQMFSGEFEDKATKKKVPYHQIGILEKTETGLKLVKVSVPADKVADAAKCDDRACEVLADMTETNYNDKPCIKLVFVSARAAVAKVA